MRVAARKVLAFLFLALAACPKRVVVNGQEMSVEDADALARRDLEGVRAEGKGLPPAQAAARLEAFAARYRGVPAGGDALHEAAELRRAAGDPARAAEDLRTLLGEHPLHPRAVQAKYLLALSDIELGRTRDGLASLATLYEKLPAEARPGAAARAAEAALAAGAEADAVRWLATLAETQDGEARTKTLARATAAVDALGLEDADGLRRALPQDSPLQEPLAMKVARVHLHLRDYASAEQAAREVFLRWPHGPYADDAKRLVDRISRLTYVRPNVLGVAVPLSGNYKRWGEAILQGVSLALEGSGVKVAVRDTRGEPDGAAAALEALVLEEGAIAVVGGVTNAEGERAAAAAEELQIPFVSLSKQEGITAAGPFVFQNMLTASEQAEAIVGLAMGKRGMRRFAVLYPSMSYGVELANAFWDDLEARGGEVRAAETYAPDRTTFTPLVKSMVGKLYLEDRSDWQEQSREIAEKEKDPFRRRKALEKAREKLPPIADFDAIFIPDFAKNVKLIAPALAVEDVLTQTCEPEAVEKLKKLTGRPDLRPVQLFGANGWGGDPGLFDQSPGGAGRHVRCAIYVDGFFAGSARPGTKRFVEAFEHKFPGQTPTILEASAYDAAGMARQVIEHDRAQTRAALRDGLAAVRGFKGATGELTMGADRTPERELFFLTVDANGLREMKPEELAGPGAGGM
ncbi:penicillin-binding protein activator [Anaeromyxobacter terrae]|uniref:penicillin-binding protein activator n=1 Tax=Anaeromyxobacter terrae TaxID=2925406 RepID=UPI001F56CA8C|nr:penicillin-binding protein activator [Anaeromyxobacter sp. SG22]